MKMKLALTAFAVTSLAAIGTASADKVYNMAGCGLGSIVISSDGFVQIFAATTNGSTANQTFGITSGTSNCTKSGVILASKEQEAMSFLTPCSWMRGWTSLG